MENFYIAANAVAPMFLIMAAGCVVKRLKIISESTARQANDLCFRVFMSTLLFYNTYSSDINRSFQPQVLLFCVLGILAEFFLWIPLSQRVTPSPPAQGVLLQASFRTNITLLGIPIVTSLFGSENTGEITILLAFLVPLINILGVVSLEIFRGGKPDARKIIRNVAANPLVDGALLGALTVLLGLRLPYVLETAIRDVADATMPLSLLLLGASLDFSRFGSTARSLTGCVIYRLILSPGAFLALAFLIGFRGFPLIAVLLVFGTPVAVASYTVAVTMGGDSDLAGNIVLMTTGFSCVTLFLWIWLLKTLYLF